MNREPSSLLTRTDALELQAESREAEGYALEARLSGFRCAAPLALQLVVVEDAPQENPFLKYDGDEIVWPGQWASEEDKWRFEDAYTLKEAWLAGAPLS